MSYVFAHPELFPVTLLGFVDPTDHYAYRGILTDTGEVRKYDSFRELVSHVTQRREALQYPPIPYLDLQIQHYLYMVGEAPRSHFVKADVIADIPRTIQGDVVTGARIALELSRQAATGIFTATQPSGFTTKQEAERRAKICVNCPKNVLIRKNKLQRINNKIASLFTLRRNTRYDDRLYDCGVCGCPLAEKVHFADELIRDVTPRKYKAEHFPENFIGIDDRERYECWMRKILEKEK